MHYSRLLQDSLIVPSSYTIWKGSGDAGLGSAGDVSLGWRSSRWMVTLTFCTTSPWVSYSSCTVNKTASHSPSPYQLTCRGRSRVFRCSKPTVSCNVHCGTSYNHPYLCLVQHRSSWKGDSVSLPVCVIIGVRRGLRGYNHRNERLYIMWRPGSDHTAHISPCVVSDQGLLYLYAGVDRL